MESKKSSLPLTPVLACSPSCCSTLPCESLPLLSLCPACLLLLLLSALHAGLARQQTTLPRCPCQPVPVMFSYRSAGRPGESVSFLLLYLLQLLEVSAFPSAHPPRGVASPGWFLSSQAAHPWGSSPSPAPSLHSEGLIKLRSPSVPLALGAVDVAYRLQ